MLRKIGQLVVIRLILLLIISYIAGNTVSYLGFFPYRELAEQSGLPQFIYSFANFDGVHYINIADRGYDTYEQAFFPLYPLSVRFIAPLLNDNFLVAGLLISNLSLFVSIIFLYRLFKNLRTISFMWFIFFLLSFPTAFFFSVMYSESFFLMLVVMSVYYLVTDDYKKAGLCAGLSSLARLNGIFLIIPFAVYLYQKKKHLGRRDILLVLAPLAGFAVYACYLWVSTGDPFFFVNSQWAFGANRSTSIIPLPQVYYRYLKIFLTTRVDHIFFIAVVEFVSVTISLCIALYELIRSYRSRLYFEWSVAVFSLIVVILPTLTGTFSSVPRYALLSLSTFIFLSRLKNARLKITIGIVCIMLQIVLFSMFIQGYFVS